MSSATSGVVLAGIALVLLPWISRPEGATVAELVTASTTALAAAIALFGIAAQRRRTGPPDWYVGQFIRRIEDETQRQR